MSDATVIPPIEELVPQRGTMLLLDRVTAFTAETASAEYTPRSGAWYADEAGNMPAWIGIELMAQTVAAHVALIKCDDGLPPRLGALLGTRRYHSAVPAFAAGVALRIEVAMAFRDASGLGAYECAIRLGAATLASATLKVYEPEDFNTFVQGSSQ